jgi:hypothetical protein
MHAYFRSEGDRTTLGHRLEQGGGLVWRWTKLSDLYRSYMLQKTKDVKKHVVLVAGSSSSNTFGAPQRRSPCTRELEPTWVV